MKVIAMSEDIDDASKHSIINESDKIVWTNKNDKLEVEIMSEFPD